MEKVKLAIGNLNSYEFIATEFSDGQINLKLNPVTYGNAHVDNENREKSANVSFYPESFRDFELLIQAVHIVRQLGFNTVSLYIPYFFGARSDRQFSDYETNYVKNVVAPIINSLNCNEVWVVTPHSDVVEACINNCRIFNGFRNRKIFPSLAEYAGITAENSIFVSPDGGALKRVYNLVEEIKLTNSDHVVCANKHRDIATGNILSTQIDLSYVNWKTIENIVILDDICDGGRTFIELSKVIRSLFNTKDLETLPLEGKNLNLVLYVTHPIFSKGLEPLFEHFDKILTTTSRKSFMNLVDEKITREGQEGVSKFETSLQSQKVTFKNNKELYVYYL